MRIETPGSITACTKSLFISGCIWDNQKLEDMPGSGIFYQKSNMNTVPGKILRPG
jgi:hypothetical protein